MREPTARVLGPHRTPAGIRVRPTGTGRLGWVIALAMGAIATAAGSPEDCVQYLNFPEGNLRDQPTLVPSAAACRMKCAAEQSCALYSFIGPAGRKDGKCLQSTGSNGCCWLKSIELSGKAPTVWQPYACSGYVRPPTANGTNNPGNPGNATADVGPPPPARSPAAGKKNVLYLLVDDLRPDLLAYGQGFTHNPNIAKLAATGMVFDNAYCQIAVCSPSRMSFLTGRRPDHAGIYNFINHFRQADCGLSDSGMSYAGASIVEVNTNTFGGGCQWGGSAGACGGSGQCCSLCTAHDECAFWTYTGDVCALKYSNATEVADPLAVSGRPGTTATHAGWTSNPGIFKAAGYLTVHTGKIFHTEEGGVANADPDLNGPGMPPNSDPRSWSPGLAMGQVNAVANMWGVGSGELNGVNATLDGVFLETSAKVNQLADRVIGQDAVAKLRLASMNLAETGQPFYLACGFRKPHLPFRFPSPFLQYLQPESEIAVALHPTLDLSVPPIAHGDHPPQNSPYTAPANGTAQQWRQHYYASIAWMDHQLGLVTDELDTLGHTADTLVVLHSDHGWSLGEHGEWQKFSNFEHGVRVPLIIRAPWLAQSAGTRSRALAELIDVLPTMAGLIGVPLPAGEVFDGKSLAPLLSNPTSVALADSIKPFAMSQYMRCPRNASVLWKNNYCLFTDRVNLPYMGYTIRTRKHRYTEWTKWNGSALRPDHTPAGLVGVELYSHEDVGAEYSFDEFENVNEATGNPDVVATMRALLHAAIANQTRIKSFNPALA